VVGPNTVKIYHFITKRLIVLILVKVTRIDIRYKGSLPLKVSSGHVTLITVLGKLGVKILIFIQIQHLDAFSASFFHFYTPIWPLDIS